jgi:diguanylate cyclase (GGDEF)-like protein/PAS domain S-box-containing protein
MTAVVWPGARSDPDPAHDNYELALALRELQLAHGRLAELAQRHRLLLESSAEAIAVLDERGRLHEWNAAALEPFGGNADALQRWLWSEAAQGAGTRLHPALESLIDGRSRADLKVEIADSAGRRRWLEISTQAVADAATGRVRTVICRFGDVTARLLRERALTMQAIADPLTGLFNRRHLEERLAAEISRARRSGQPLAVAVGDLDHFKRVNDRFGHAAGDRALQAFAAALRESLRLEDVVGRLGGDEFCALLPGASAGRAAGALRRVLDKLRHTVVETQAGRFRISGSFGVAELAAGLDATGLLARADAALYRAKARGRGRVVADPR